MKQHTGNWCGKTVSSAVGTYETKECILKLVDLPGTYSLFSQSQDELVTKAVLASGEMDYMVIVCDALCLERNLQLVLQILSSTKSVLLCVNLMDEARKKGVQINLDLLSHLLGIPVIGTTARKKKSIQTLCNTLTTLVMKSSGKITCQTTRSYDVAMVSILQKSHIIALQCVSYTKVNYHEKDRKLDQLFTSRCTGFPIMFLLLCGIFWLTIVGANYPSTLLSNALFSLEGHLSACFLSLPIPVWIHDILILGVYRVLAWVISVMLPPMAIFFPLFTLLEDAGYLPRIAYNLDHSFQKCRACGKQALCMCMGFGCNAVGVIGCRIIDSPRERMLAILTNNFVPCNGRFPTLIVLITMFFIQTDHSYSAFLCALLLCGTILLSIVITLLVTKLLSCTILKGMPSSFVLELPPYRTPQFTKVLVRSLVDRTYKVLCRAIVVAAPAGLVIWILANATIGNMSLLSYCANFLDPLGKLMGLDGVILLSFFLGFPANEIVLPIMVMAYLSQGTLIEIGELSAFKDLLVTNGWTPLTAVCTILFSLMHWPCSTTLLTIFKETKSIKWTILAAVLPTTIGMLTCMLLTWICHFIF